MIVGCRVGMALAVAGSAIAIAGCGGSDGGGSTAEGPVKVGVLVPLTGPLAQIGKDQVDGMRLFVKQTPSVAGRKLGLVVEDTGGDPRRAVTKARKLLTRDKVDLVAGVASSGELNAVKDQIMARKVPLVVTNAGLDAFTATTPSTGFRVSHANSQNNRVLAWYARKELGYSKVAVLATDFVAGVEHTAAFKGLFEDLGGKVVSEVKPPLGTADYAPFISRIPKDVDAVYVFVVGGDAIKFWKQAKALGLNRRLKLIGPGFVADDLILSVVGDAADGFVGSLQYVNTIGSQANKAFVSAYQQFAGRPADQYSSDAYTGMAAIAAGLEATKGAGGDALIKALASARFRAPRGEVSFDERHQAVLDVRVYEVENGKPVIKDVIKAVGQDWQPPS